MEACSTFCSLEVLQSKSSFACWIMDFTTTSQGSIGEILWLDIWYILPKRCFVLEEIVVDEMPSFIPHIQVPSENEEKMRACGFQEVLDARVGS